MLTDSQIQQIEKEVRYLTSRSGGKGGQHVNKVESKVQIFWNVSDSMALNDEQKVKLLKNGVFDNNTISLISQKSRSQIQNKEEVFNKLIALINKLLRPQKKRLKTKASKSSKEKKLQNKKLQGLKKQNRQKPTI